MDDYRFSDLVDGPSHDNNPDTDNRVRTDVLSREQPSREQAEAAVRTLIEWIGEDPAREGLVDTPARFIRAWEEFFVGYKGDPVAELQRTFEDSNEFSGMITLKSIRIESHCEHHLVPILGWAHIAYLPDQRVVGISKLARVAQIFAKRMQIQEKLTAQIATTIQTVLQPKGVAVLIEAQHQCISTRGVHMNDVNMVTSKMLGLFETDQDKRHEFYAAINRSSIR